MEKQTAKIFQSILSPKPLSWDSYSSKPPEVPDNFMADREDSLPQERELL